MIKLVLTDLDGTLFLDDKTISKYTTNVLKKIRKKGIKIGFCTGRATNSIHSHIKKISPDVVIANGGAEIFIDNELIYSCGFSAPEVQVLFDSVYRVCGSNAEITCDSEGEVYWNRTQNAQTSLYSDKSIFHDFKSFNQTAMKICVQTWDEEKALAIASSLGLEKVNYIKFSDVPWYSFYKKEATKENAIKTLSKHMFIDLKDIVAFGDDFNDIGMLKLCGTGVAMENAILQVKECADEITLSNNQNGVAIWLEKRIAM